MEALRSAGLRSWSVIGPGKTLTTSCILVISKLRNVNRFPRDAEDEELLLLLLFATLHTQTITAGVSIDL